LAFKVLPYETERHTNGVAKGWLSPQFSRQDISIRLNCTKLANLVSLN